MNNKERVNSGITGYAGLEVKRTKRLMKEKGVIVGLRSSLSGAIENLHAVTQEFFAKSSKDKVLIFSHPFLLIENELSSRRFGLAKEAINKDEENFVSPSQEGGIAMIEVREAGAFFGKLGKRGGQMVSIYRDCFGSLPGMFLRFYIKKEGSYEIEQRNVYLRIASEEREKLEEKISQKMEAQEVKNDKGETVGKFFVADRQENFLNLKDVIRILKTTLSLQRQEELNGWLTNLQEVAVKERGEIKADAQPPAYAGREIGIRGTPSGIFFEGKKSINRSMEPKRGDNPEPLGPEAAQVNLDLPSPELTAKESLAFLSQGKVVTQQKMVLPPFVFQEKSQAKQTVLSLNQPEIPVTQESSLHNFQRSRENVQSGITEEKVIEEISVRKEQRFIGEERESFLPPLDEQISLDMKQQEIAVETAKQPITDEEKLIFVRKEEVENSIVVDQSSEELLLKEPVEKETVVAEREEVVVFEAPEPVTELVTSGTEPFVFIRRELRKEEKLVSEIAPLQLLQQVEDVVLPVLIVPSFEQAEQTVYVEKETSQSVMREMIEKKVTRREEQKETTETREKRIVLPKTEVWTPKIFPLNLFSPERKKTIPEVSIRTSRPLSGEPCFSLALEIGLHLRGVKNRVLEFKRRRDLGWIELLPPKEISLITALARDKFGVNYPNSSTKLADLVLFWLVAMNLLAQKPILYKLELDFTPLTVKVRDGKILVARRVIPEEILGREDLLVEGRQFFPRPFLFLTV